MNEGDKDKANETTSGGKLGAREQHRGKPAKKEEASATASTGEEGVTLKPETESILKRIQTIHGRISGLDPELRSQALTVLMQAEFGSAHAGSGATMPRAVVERLQQGAVSGYSPESAFDELVSPFSPKDQAEWGLLASFFLSRVKGEEEISSQDVNTILKHHGHGVSHITRVLDSLTPTLLIQVRKSGTTRQARKSYKLTTTGAKEVEARLTGSGGETGQ